MWQGNLTKSLVFFGIFLPSLSPAQSDRPADKAPVVVSAKSPSGGKYEIRLQKVKVEEIEATLEQEFIRNSSGPIDGQAESTVHVLSGSRSGEIKDKVKRVIGRLTQSKKVKLMQKNVELDSEMAVGARNQFAKLFPKVGKEDVWMAVALFPLASGASVLSYFLSDTPLPLSLMISAAAGLYTSGFQLFISYWKSFLSRSASSIGKLAKFHLAEVVFLTIPPALFMMHGDLQLTGARQFIELFLQINLTATGTTATQGYIEMELVELEKADRKKGIERKVFGVGLTNVGFLTASAVAIFSALSAITAQTLHVPGLHVFSYIGFGSLAAGGYALFYFRTKRFLPQMPALIVDRWRWVKNLNSYLPTNVHRCEMALVR